MLHRMSVRDAQAIALHRANPAWGTPVRVADFIDPSLAAGAGFTFVCGFEVPQGELGIVDGFCNGVTSNSDWDNLVWQLRVNGTAVPGYHHIQGVIGLIPIPDPVFIPLLGGNTVDVYVRNQGSVAALKPTAAIFGRTFAPGPPPEG